MPPRDTALTARSRSAAEKGCVPVKETLLGSQGSSRKALSEKVPGRPSHSSATNAATAVALRVMGFGVYQSRVRGI